MIQKFRQIQITTDETAIRLAVSRAFRDSPIDPVVASNTFQALSQLDVFDFDLFLLDLDMKDGCAFELLETMSERFPRVPTLLLTTINTRSQELNNRIQEIRFDCCWDILTKPFVYQKLVSFINGKPDRKLPEQVQYHQHKRKTWQEKRNCQRFTRFEQITMTQADTGEKNHHADWHWCTLTDISLGGMGITTDWPLAAGQDLHFEEKFMHQFGTIVWVRNKVEHLWKVGIKFL